MINQAFSSQGPKSRSAKKRALLGTAAALMVGGVIAGQAFVLPESPAFAEAVRVDGVQPVSFADVVEKVRPAVVSVRVKTKADEDMAAMPSVPFEQFEEFFGDRNSPMERFFRQFRDGQGDGEGNRQFRWQSPFATSLGSGFIISEDGYVVTNDHVVGKGQSVTVILDDGTEYEAKVVGVDEKTDLALLKINNPDRKFTYVKFAEDQVRVGDWVVAVGNPFGLGGTVTAGIVSASGRDIGSGPYDDFIQIDAAVNRGNSGGPAFNLRGEVIGVNTAIFSPSGGNVGIAFAIPASAAEKIVADLKDDGKVVRGWLGVQIQGVTRDIADGLNLKEAKGSLVAEAQPDSPAAAAGLKSGDTILAVDGKEVEGPRELAAMIAEIDPGTKVKITYWRDGAEHDIDVTLGTLPGEEQLAAVDPSEQAEPEHSALDDFGLAVAPAEDNSGVMVTDVDPNGQAAERGLQPGDVILSVGDDAVASPADVEKMVEDAKEGGMKAVLLRVKSGDQTRFVALSFARA
ncbi:MAG TPA: DegQ family serine endoprotease [Bauldia sp.]|nr:DegQ family serine endoprotease [Bauldia sp.]